MSPNLRKAGIVLLALGIFLFHGQWIAHSGSFSPTLGFLLLAGWLSQGRPFGLFAALIAYLLGDLSLVAVGAEEFVVSYPGMAVNYLALAALCFIGLFFWRPQNEKGQGFWVFPMMAFSGAFSFFLLSNLGVWLFSGLYPLSFAGLTDCYLMAIPFFRSSLGPTLVTVIGIGSLCLGVTARSFSGDGVQALNGR